MPDLRATVSRHENRAGGERTAPVRGFLSGLPRVGAPLILYTPEADGSVARLITSLVQRVLGGPDGALFVETRQSVYRVVLHEPITQLPPPSRLRVSFDGFELTVVPGSSSDAASNGSETSD